MKTNLEKELIFAIEHIRNALAERDIGSFDLKITASGRTQTGGALLQFSLSEHGWDATEGGTLEAVLEEFLRRKGWSHFHKPLSLPFLGDITEEEPF